MRNIEDLGINLNYVKGLPSEHLKYYGTPMPSSCALTWCMHATGFNRIFTREDMKEFFFRLAISLESMSLVETWLEKGRLMTYHVDGSEYILTLQDVIAHFGIEVANSLHNSSSRKSFLNSIKDKIGSAMLIGSLNGFSVIPPVMNDNGEIKYTAHKHVSELTDTLISKAEFFAADLMKFVPEELFEARHPLMDQKEIEIEERGVTVRNLPEFDIESIPQDVIEICLGKMFNSEFSEKCLNDRELFDKSVKPLIYLAWLWANDLMESDGIFAYEKEGVKLDHQDYELEDGGSNLLTTTEDYNLRELSEYLKIGSFWMQKRTCLDMQRLSLLFICQFNVVRSRTAEILWDSYGWSTKSAGIDEDSRVRITPELINWADVIFVMEDYQAEYMRENFAAQIGNRNIVVLDVHENFSFMQKELKELLTEKVTRYLESLPA